MGNPTDTHDNQPVSNIFLMFWSESLSVSFHVISVSWSSFTGDKKWNCSHFSAVTSSVNFFILQVQLERRGREFVKERCTTGWRTDPKNWWCSHYHCREVNLFYKHRNIFTQAQMLLSKTPTFWKMTLLYLTKRCLKCYLEWVQSFWNGLIVHISLVCHIRVLK